jgi:hypothetical protein
MIRISKIRVFWVKTLVLSKRREIFTQRHSEISQKTRTFSKIDAWTSNLDLCFIGWHILRASRKKKNNQVLQLRTVQRDVTTQSYKMPLYGNETLLWQLGVAICMFSNETGNTMVGAGAWEHARRAGRKGRPWRQNLTRELCRRWRHTFCSSVSHKPILKT